MAINNRTCLCCGTYYSYCPNCSGADRLAPSWKANFCSEDCKDLWLTCTHYNMGKITKPEAQSTISSISLKPITEYAKCVQRDLGVILKEDPKLKRSKRTKTTIVEEILDLESHEVVKQENE